jgi:nucleoside-diphosphate-sugar epimerase
MKILITGGTGYIGSKLAYFLVNNNHEVFLLSRKNSDLCLIRELLEKVKLFEIENDYSVINKVINEVKPDITIHLASLFINNHNTEQLVDIVGSNILFGTLLLESLVNNDCPLIINTGTSWQHYNNEDYNPVNLYAASKQAFEDILKYYIEAKGVRAITLKLFDTFGEDDNRPKIFNLLKKHSQEKTEILMSNGEQEIDLVHINDVVSAFNFAINELIDSKEIKYKTYGVATGKPRKLREWVEDYIVTNNLQVNIKWGYREYGKREVMSTWKKFSKINSLIFSNIFNKI